MRAFKFEHGEDDHGDRQTVAYHAEKELGEKLADRLCVVGDVRDQSANRVAVKKGHRLPLNVGEQVDANLANDALPGILQQQHLGVVGHQSEQ